MVDSSKSKAIKTHISETSKSFFAPFNALPLSLKIIFILNVIGLLYAPFLIGKIADAGLPVLSFTLTGTAAIVAYLISHAAVAVLMVAMWKRYDWTWKYAIAWSIFGLVNLILSLGSTKTRIDQALAGLDAQTAQAASSIIYTSAYAGIIAAALYIVAVMYFFYKHRSFFESHSHSTYSHVTHSPKVTKKYETRSMAADETVTFKVSRSMLMLFVGLLIGFLFGFGIAALSGGSGGSATGGTNPGNEGTAQALNVDVDDDPVLGNANAPITIIEFSDYQCPFCRRFYSTSYQDIIKNYIDTGKAKLVFRDFPLGFHEAAVPYAIAANCAGDQGKYWEMHDKLYDEQNKLGQGTIPHLGDAKVKEWAASLGLNTATFNQCYDSKTYENEIKADLNDGVTAGVGGTPSFFISNDGKKWVQVSGALPYAVFQQTINDLL